MKITPTKNPVPLPHVGKGPLRKLAFGDVLDVDMAKNDAYWQRRLTFGEVKLHVEPAKKGANVKVNR